MPSEGVVSRLEADRYREHRAERCHVTEIQMVNILEGDSRVGRAHGRNGYSADERNRYRGQAWNRLADLDRDLERIEGDAPAALLDQRRAVDRSRIGSVGADSRRTIGQEQIAGQLQVVAEPSPQRQVDLTRIGAQGIAHLIGIVGPIERVAVSRVVGFEDCVLEAQVGAAVAREVREIESTLVRNRLEWKEAADAGNLGGKIVLAQHL